MSRRNPHRLHHLARPLRSRVELPYAVNLIPPQLDPHRHIRRDRENVDNPAAPAHHARRVHRGLEPIPQPPPHVQQFPKLHILAAPQRMTARRRHIPPKRPLHQPPHRRHHHYSSPVCVLRAFCGYSRQNSQPLMHRLHIRVQPLERQNLRLREMQQSRVFPAPRHQLLMQPAGVFGTRRDHQHRRVHIPP